MSPATKGLRRLSTTVGVVTLAAVLTVVFSAAGGEAGELTPVSLPSFGPSDGLRFLGVDNHGRVFALTSETMEVWPLTSEGAGEPSQLGEEAGFGRRSTVIAAAMGDSSDEWLVRTSAFGVTWFRSGKLLPLPETDWLVQDVTLAKGEPVVAVVPVGQGGGLEPPSTPPLLLGKSGKRWVTLVDGEVPDDGRLTSQDGRERQAAYRELRWRRAVDLATDPQGHVWVASDYAYRVVEYSSAGHELMVLTVGDPVLEVVERPEEEREELRAMLEAQGRKVPQAALTAMPKAAVLGLSASSGRLYVLVHTEAGVALDRWNPVTLQLERARLAGKLPVRKMRLAAGSDGLYLALVEGGGGWWIPWSEIEAGVWSTVDDVRLNDAPLAVPAEESATEARNTLR